MRVNYPRSTNQDLPALTAAAARRFDRIAVSGGERISSTERQLIEACVRAMDQHETRPREASSATINHDRTSRNGIQSMTPSVAMEFKSPVG